MSDDAIERLALYFANEETRQGLLARTALGCPAPGDGLLTRRLVERCGHELRPDGSLGGAAVPTVWRLHELLDLGSSPAAGPAARALGWVLALQGRSGAFGEGCDRERHARRMCDHFVAGFFAPAPPTQRLAPITLPHGKPFRAEPAARFAISCLALRVVLRAGLGARPAVRQHIASLAVLAEQWTTWGGYFAPDLILAGLHALALAGPERRGLVQRLAALAAASQDPDGGWPSADFFHTLEALHAAGTQEALVAVRRAVPALTSRQRPDGTFGATAQQERALIGLRALLWAQRGERAMVGVPLSA